LGTPYSEKINTADTKAADDGQLVTIEKTINLSDLQNTAGLTKDNPTKTLLIRGGGVVLALAVIALAIWYAVRKRASRPMRPANHQGDPLVATTIPSLAKKHKSSLSTQDPLPAHAGQSLASMVMEAMQQERLAKQQPQNTPQQPTTNNYPPNTPPTVPPPMVPPAAPPRQ
jgi:hypothetical protein